MKISLNWLEQILGSKITVPPQQLAEKLLDLGFEVSSIQNYPQCSGVTVSKILEISKHPNADRLRIAKVTDGKETLDVVCGAPNIEAGQTVFWAKVGAVLADGEKIKESAIRGVKSPGMLCSAKELGISEDHDGILVLNENDSLGLPLEKIVKLDDTIFEIEVTPNRPDCLSVTGIAREIAAAFNLKMKDFSSENYASLPVYPVVIEDPQNCAQYIARKIENAAVKTSPLWMQIFLIRCGIRPINNVVDITNFVLMETGQPLHAFDADKLDGGKIVVRKAKAEEKILALDGKTYALDPELLVIADAKKPVAIAGIMGGEETAVTSQTKNILLESAIFNTRIVRSGRRKLNLSSESSYRFERGVSIWSCSAASARAEQLIVQTAGGKLTAFNSTGKPPASSSIALRALQVEKILGEKLERSEIESPLKKLGVQISAADEKQLTVQSPDWRLDLNLEIDFIEEIVRLRSYEKIPSTGTTAQLAAISKPADRSLMNQKIRHLLQSAGFYECLNYGLVSKKNASKFVDDKSQIELENPLSEEQSVLRPSLLIELLGNLKLNFAYQKKEVRLFEMGTAFCKSDGEPIEKNRCAAVASGQTLASTWQLKEPAPVDFYWIKGIVQKILETAHIENFRFDPISSAKYLVALVESKPMPNLSNILHPIYSFELWLSEEKMPAGFFGVLHPSFAKQFDLKETVVLLEMDMETIEKHAIPHKKIMPVNRTPSIQRDCSIWINEKWSWNEIMGEIKQAGSSLLEDCTLFDLYRDPASPNLKSLSFTLTFHHPEKTLDDETANQTRDKIVQHLHQKLNAELRKK